MMDGVKEEGKAQGERNDGGEAGRERGHGVKEDRAAGRGEMKEGKQVHAWESMG